MTWSVLAAAVLLVVLGAVLAAGETAAFSIGRSRLRTLLEEGFSGARELDRVRSRSWPVRRAVRLLGTTLDLVALGLFVLFGAQTGGMAGAALAIPAGVLALLLFAEVGPRVLAARHPIRIALVSAPWLLWVETGARIVSAPIVRLEELLASRGRQGRSRDSQRQVLELSAIGQAEGIVEVEEHLLVERAFRLDELNAFDVMTPRVDVFAWPDSLRLEQIIDGLRTVPYSRVPVYDGSIDDVTGILYVREAYETYVAGRPTVPLSDVSREPFFVPGSLSLSQLMRDFQARRIHMGIVADEYGGTDGIVTLEDVLEELVGEIVDETDVDDEPLMRISRDELVADGGVDLREINYAFNVSLPQLEHRSLNGYILEEMGYVPDGGESIRRGGVQIDILEATETQVVRARLRRLAEREAGGRDEAG